MTQWNDAMKSVGPLPVGYYQWLYTIERDVRVWDLTPEEISRLLQSLSPQAIDRAGVLRHDQIGEIYQRGYSDALEDASVPADFYSEERAEGCAQVQADYATPPATNAPDRPDGDGLADLEDRIVCAFSDRAILQLDLHDEDPRLAQLCDEVRNEVVRPILESLRTRSDGDVAP